ncbi:MAG: YlbF family regulator [Bacilli bacterium]
MMSDGVKQLATQLQIAITQDPSFLALKQSLQVVMQDPQGAQLLNGFITLQKNIQQKVASGAQVTTQEQQMLANYIEQMQNYPVTAAFLQKEQAFGELVNEVNGIISAPLQAFFQ